MTEEVMQTEVANELAPDQSSVETQPETGASEVNNEASETEGLNTESLESETESTANPENAKKRIEKKYKRQNRKIEELEARLSQYEAAQHMSQMHQEPQPPMQPYGEPQQIVDPINGQYLTPGTPRYEAVLYDQQRQALAQQQVQRQQQQEALYYQNKRDQAFFDALDDASDRYEDFDDVVRNDKLPLTEAMLGVAKVIPDGADFLYYIAKNPKEVERISRLRPDEQQSELAKHAFQFANKNKVTNAPAPIQPVGTTQGSGNPNSITNLAKNPTAFRKYLRAKQMRKK